MKLRQGGFLISKIHQLAGRIFAKILKKRRISEINPAQGRILFVLWQNNGISIQELAEKTALGKSTLTRMLDRLEAAGHVRRVFSHDDRRKTFIELTEQNIRLRSTYDDVSQEMIELYYQGFTPEEIDLFEDYLERIYSNLLKNE